MEMTLICEVRDSPNYKAIPIIFSNLRHYLKPLILLIIIIVIFLVSEVAFINSLIVVKKNDALTQNYCNLH